MDSESVIVPKDFKSMAVPRDLVIHPLGDNGEMEVLPSTGDILSTSRLPCGLPPILPNTDSILDSYLLDMEKLPILHPDSVQCFVPREPDVKSLFELNLSPLQTELAVKRDMSTGKLLGFVEQAKDLSGGTTKTSTSMSRAPGKPDFGVKGSTSSFPFWPGGIDEPWSDLAKKDIDTSLFDCDYLETPPGFKKGMHFKKKSQPALGDSAAPKIDKISLTDILAMEDFAEFGMSDETDALMEDIQLVKAKKSDVPDADSAIHEDDLIKIENLPVLNISEAKPTKDSVASKYKWAVIEDVVKPVEDFHKRIPQLVYKWDFELDTFQKRAILHLEKHENVFVSAHTSAGKTVVAEYAIALAKKHMTKVLYTSPIKALSNQKFRDFKKPFEDVGLITGDVQINPTAFCLIMTTEILRSMLYHGSDVVRDVEWVIFDEVHYINDAERGVVWEEVFIMLPHHVNLIMLSATAPNTAEFAEWLGGIKKRKVYVISTLKRPVPLVHHLYTGSVGKFQNDCFPIVDANGIFQDGMYLKAFNSKKDREKSKTATGPKGPRQHVTQAQEKNVYIGLLGYLKKNDLLPVVCFTLSRKRCNDHAMNLQSQNLTSTEEKHEIRSFFRKSISKLKAEDQNLHQVMVMAGQLEHGFGVHHSGILPILKEVVEMLFQKGLVKVLFATETFAMGVNMPARTVVFDSITKHDGIEFRTLQPSEYIQMAGRAGRRGLDKNGTVIILCKGEVPDTVSLRNMMLGKASSLKSQFKLTYTMILNLLKVKTLRVEDMMKRSFGECSSHQMQEKVQEELAKTMEKLSASSRPDCSLCAVDLEPYCKTLEKINSLQEEVMEKVCLQAIGTKTLAPGRVVLFSTADQFYVPGLVLSIDKDNKCKVLTMASTTGPSPESRCWSKSICISRDASPSVTTITLNSVQLISNKVLKVCADDVLKEWRKMESMKRDPGQTILSVFRDLMSVCEANQQGFSSVKINFRDIELMNGYAHLQKLTDTLKEFTCIKCPDFSKHFLASDNVLKLQNKITELKFVMSEESLQLHSEYKIRKQVLERLNYIDANETVQLKGTVAREMSNHELLITELLVKNVFTDCSPEEIAALLSCMVFQHKCRENLKDLGIPMNLLKKIEIVKDVIQEIEREQYSVGIQDPGFEDQYSFHLTHVVYEWANGVTFANIMENNIVNVEEGIIVRCIQRLSELLKDVRNGANLVGEVTLAKKMEEASRAIKRDIVFAASLYTQ